MARHERLAAPVYGDVRLLGGSELRGGTTYGGESHPVPGSWSGVPNADALAIVLGEPYDTRWPALIDRADGRQRLHFLSVPKWNSALRINAIIGDPPTSIAQPIEPDGRASMTYPSEFPFDIEKKDDRFTDRSSKFQAGWRFEHREQHFREVRKIKERIAEAVEASPDEAVHILIYHLRRGYSYHVKSALVEMLSPIARDRSVFDALVAEFEAPATDIVAEQSMGALSENPATRNHYKDVLARAIGPAARKADFARLATFVRDPRHDYARSSLFGALVRLDRVRGPDVRLEVVDQRTYVLRCSKRSGVGTIRVRRHMP